MKDKLYWEKHIRFKHHDCDADRIRCMALNIDQVNPLYTPEELLAMNTYDIPKYDRLYKARPNNNSVPSSALDGWR